MLGHFSKKHKNLFLNHNIEFLSKKGQLGAFNQDNFFSVMDGEIKIMAVFDGHGEHG